MKECKTAGNVKIDKEINIEQNETVEGKDNECEIEQQKDNEDDKPQTTQGVKSVKEEKTKKISNYSLEIYQLYKMLIKDGFKKQNLHKLRISFITCTFINQGIASSVRF